MVGDGCNAPHYVPDVFLMSIILFMGTFLLSVELKDFKNALFFPSKVSMAHILCTIIEELGRDESQLYFSDSEYTRFFNAKINYI